METRKNKETTDTNERKRTRNVTNFGGVGVYRRGGGTGPCLCVLYVKEYCRKKQKVIERRKATETQEVRRDENERRNRRGERREATGEY